MTCISTIDLQTRLDVHELLARFSHFLDHGRGACWAELFTTDGVFECHAGERIEGMAALAELPGRVGALGGGNWRHIVTGIIVDRLPGRKDLVARAYGPVVDMGQAGALAAFYDYEFTLRLAARWRIKHAKVTQVGDAVAAGAAAIAQHVPAAAALQ